MDDGAPPNWSSAFREVGLVGLQAAVLTRRIFLPPVERGELRPEQHQILMALALTESAPYEHRTVSLEALASQLTLDRDDVAELVYDLLERGSVKVVDEYDEDPPAMVLTDAGWTQAHHTIERVRRFLPGWPPEARAEPAI
jgi:DNA-binding MarR family transcriptional regulator